MLSFFSACGCCRSCSGAHCGGGAGGGAAACLAVAAEAAAAGWRRIVPRTLPNLRSRSHECWVSTLLLLSVRPSFFVVFTFPHSMAPAVVAFIDGFVLQPAFQFEVWALTLQLVI